MTLCLQCGLQKPQCSQCIKSNLVCSGYQRDRIFVNSGLTSRVQKEQMKSVPSEGTNDRKSSVPTLGLAIRKRPLVGTSSSIATDMRLGPDIAPHALYRQQLLNAFLGHFIPASQFGPAEERSWLVLLAELPTSTKALEISTLALCTAKVGRENNDAVLVKESLSLYTQGLREMQKALWNFDLMYKDETLGACMALAMYELFECPAENRRAYASHQDGCAKLVQLRGAEAHGSGLAHQIFLSFRRQSVRPLSRLFSIFHRILLILINFREFSSKDLKIETRNSDYSHRFCKL